MTDQFWNEFNNDWNKKKTVKTTQSIFPVKHDNSLNLKILDLESKINTLTNENNKLKTDNKNYNNKFKTENHILECKNLNLQDEIKNLQIKIKNSEEIIKSLQKSIDDKDKIIENNEIKLKEIEEKELNLKNKEEKLNNLENELKNIINDLEKNVNNDIRIIEPITIKKNILNFTIFDRIEQFDQKLNLISSIESGETISTKNMTKMVHSSWSTAFWRKYYGEDRIELINWIDNLFDDIIIFKRQIDDPEFKDKLKELIFRMYNANENLNKLKETYNNDIEFKNRLDIIYKKSLDFFEDINL